MISYLDSVQPRDVDHDTLRAICRHVDQQLQRTKPVSRSYVLDILSGTDIPIERSLGGLPVDLRGRVHFHDAESAADSLLEMTKEYEAARARGDKDRADACRRAVLQGKDRLKLVLRRRGLSIEKRQEKQELLDWFLVWLKAPQLFPQWIALRKKATSGGDGKRHTDQGVPGSD